MEIRPWTALGSASSDGQEKYLWAFQLWFWSVE
jgi:hypothetical protein